MTGRGRAVVRALFVLAPVYVLFQHIVTNHVGEPYPAIALPAFGGHILDSGGEQHVIAPRMTVTFTDGTTARLSHEQLYAGVRTLPLSMAKWMFLAGRDADGVVTSSPRTGVLDLLVNGASQGRTYAVPGRPVTQDPGVRRWLRARLAVLFPGRTASSLSVRWVVARYALPGGYRGDEPTPVSSVTVPL